MTPAPEVTTTRTAIGLSAVPGSAKANAAIERYCTQHNLTLTAVYDAADHLEQAVEDACAAKAVLVAESLDAAANTMLDVVRLGKRLGEAGAHLALVAEGVDTSNGGGDAVFTLLDAMANLEYHRLADRLPFGYRVADDLEHIVADRDEAEVVRRIVDWHRDNVALADIAAKLNAEGVVPRRAEKWTANAVKKVVDHEWTSRWDYLDQ